MDNNNMANQNQQPVYVQQVATQPEVSEEYRPITMWGYFGYQLLFSIPCIGFIALIINAVSAKNINVRNFARSYFCVAIIWAVIIGIIFAAGGAAVIAEMTSLGLM